MPIELSKSETILYKFLFQKKEILCNYMRKIIKLLYVYRHYKKYPKKLEKNKYKIKYSKINIYRDFFTLIQLKFIVLKRIIYVRRSKKIQMTLCGFKVLLKLQANIILILKVK